MLYRFFAEKPRIHGSKTLLARLRNLFMDAGRENEAKVIGRLVSEYRDALDILEESYIMARYGELSYGEKQGKLCVSVAKKILEVLKSIEEGLA